MQIAELHEVKALEMACHEHEVDQAQKYYTELSQEGRDDTSPLLLDSAVIFLVKPSCCCNDTVIKVQCKQLLKSARHERDTALMLARHFRDITSVRQSNESLRTNLRRK